MEHNFKKKFGQNFLTDKNLLQAIVADAGVTKDDCVLEIGAGAGALTQALCECAKKVVAYEIDTDLKPTLQSLALKNAEFVFADVLKEDISKIESHFDGEYKLVANLPYYITTPLLFKFLEESQNVRSLTVMVQKEVALRMVATPGGKDYGVLTVMIALFGQAKIMRNVDKKMFTPMPNVDSAVVRIDRQSGYENVDRKAFYDFVKTCFSMRRKTLANNLSSGLKLSKDVLEKCFSKQDLARRAETFSLDEFVKMFGKLKNLSKNEK